MTEKIKCAICGADIHAVQIHLREVHPEVTLADYQARFPEAPLLSEIAKQRLAEKQAQKGQSPVTDSVPAVMQMPMHEIFGLGEAPAAKTASGKPLMVSVLPADPQWAHMVPERDNGYVFNIDTLKTLLMCVEMNIPALTWGHMGTGKSTIWEQIASVTKRPAMRIQHTINTEEAHVVGQWVLEGGSTKWRPGLLPMAMRYGWLYIADEYDFAVPQVLALYQPVLEGKALIIKDADDEWRHVKPHPNFRFAATGNTNGVGDETGLYQGTQIQNAANYERFGVVIKMDFMEASIEKRLLQTKTGLSAGDAEKMVKFANLVRNDKQISLPISPRSLIRASQLGILKGDFRQGVMLAYLNRLPAVERETASAISQRVFG